MKGRQTMSWADVRSYYIERDDDGRPDFKMLRETEHTARKQHRCDCGDVIAVGERYRAEVFLLDGELQNSKVGLGHVHSWDRDVMEQARAQGLVDENDEIPF